MIVDCQDNLGLSLPSALSSFQVFRPDAPDLLYRIP